MHLHARLAQASDASHRVVVVVTQRLRSFFCGFRFMIFEHEAICRASVRSDSDQLYILGDCRMETCATTTTASTVVLYYL